MLRFSAAGSTSTFNPTVNSLINFSSEVPSHLHLLFTMPQTFPELSDSLICSFCWFSRPLSWSFAQELSQSLRWYFISSFRKARKQKQTSWFFPLRGACGVCFLSSLGSLPVRTSVFFLVGGWMFTTYEVFATITKPSRRRWSQELHTVPSRTKRVH